MSPHATGQLFVISAPSGAGKTSLVRALRERVPQLAVSTSHTTRAPRVNEEDGREYFFVSHGEFDVIMKSGARVRLSRTYRAHLELRLGQSL